jgi:hypothetical protein
VTVLFDLLRRDGETVSKQREHVELCQVNLADAFSSFATTKGASPDHGDDLAHATDSTSDR